MFYYTNNPSQLWKCYCWNVQLCGHQWPVVFHTVVMRGFSSKYVMDMQGFWGQNAICTWNCHCWMISFNLIWYYFTYSHAFVTSVFAPFMKYSLTVCTPVQIEVQINNATFGIVSDKNRVFRIAFYHVGFFNSKWQIHFKCVWNQIQFPPTIKWPSVWNLITLC